MDWKWSLGREFENPDFAVEEELPAPIQNTTEHSVEVKIVILMCLRTNTLYFRNLSAEVTLLENILFCVSWFY